MIKKLSCLMMLPVIAGGAQIAHAQQLEEILITATKRVSNVQEIPMSVSAVDGEQITQLAIKDLTDLSKRVPSLTVISSVGDKNITMRGMGSPSGQRGMEQAVVTYVDGVYNPRSKQLYNAFLDVGSVEVLRGPQAVLFGVNATAGAINILSESNRPGDEFESSIKLEYETENESSYVTGMVGGSLGDSLGARLVVRYDDVGGYYDTNSGDGGDQDNISGRLSLVWEPSDRLSITTKIDYFDVEFDGNLTEQINPYGDGSVIPREHELEYEYDTPALALTGELDGPGFESDGYNLSVSADYELGEHNLTATFTSSDLTHQLGTDFDSGAFVAPGVHAMSADSFGREEFEQSTFELRLTSPVGDFMEYMVGIYGQTAETEDRSASIPTALEQAGLYDALGGLFGLAKGPGGQWDIPYGSADLDIDQDLISLYGNVTFKLSETLRVSVGGRYTDEEKDVERSRACGHPTDGWSLVKDSAGAGLCGQIDAFYAALGVAGAFFSTAENTVDSKRDRDSDDFLPEASVMWDISDNHTLFARAAKAVKSGGMSSSFAVAASEMLFDQEEVVGIDVGSKLRFAEGRGELNSTVFYNSYDDLQVTSITLSGARVSNAGEATIQGVEFDGRFLATDWLTLRASVSLLDAEYDDYEGAQCNPRPDSKLDVLPDGSCDASGMAPPFAADYSYNLAADVVYPINDGLNLLLGASVSGSDDYYTDGTFNEGMRQDSYSLTDAYIGLSEPGNQWSVSVIGKNLTDETLGGPGIDLNGAFATHIVSLGSEPRTVTLQAIYNF